MATTATKLKIAKTKPAPHKILPAEYRRAHFAKMKPAPHKILLAEYRHAHFWDISAADVFLTAFPPLFAAFFS
jgi:hypothetical protein